MSLTATYNQVNSQSDKWIATFTVGGKYYAIRESYGALYEILNGNTTYKRNLGTGAVLGGTDCDGTYIYTLNATNILKIDPNTGSVSSSSSTPDLRSIGIDVGGSKVFAITNAGALYVFTTNNMTQYYVNHLGASTYGPKMVYLNGALYIPVYGGQIKKYVVDTGVLSTLSNTSPLGWLSLSTDGTYVYGTVDNGYIYRIDPTDATAMEYLSGDSATRAWYSNIWVSGELWAAAYNGYCYKVTLPPITTPPEVPTASPTTSTIYNDTLVTLSCATSGATIKYTTDGTTPSATNGTTYSAPFTVSETTTIKFCAIKDGYVTAGVDVVLSWAGMYTKVNDQILAEGYGVMCVWGNYSYAYRYGYGIYKLGLYDNSSVEIIDNQWWIEGTEEYTINYGDMWTNGTVIVVTLISRNSMPGVGVFDMTGTLLHIIEYEMNHGTNNFIFDGTNLYVEVTSATTRELWLINLTTYATTKSFDHIDHSVRHWVKIGSTTYIINYEIDYNYPPGERPCTIWLRTFNTSTGVFTTVKEFVPFIVSSIGVTGVASDDYRIFISMYSDGLYILNMSDLMLSYMEASSATVKIDDLAYISGGLYGVADYLYRIRTSVDLGTPSIYKSGSWKTEQALYVRHNSAWQLANKAFKVKNGLWTRIY